MTTVLDAIKVELTISREAVLREAEAVPDHLFDERPSDDVWSTAEILDHLTATERRVSGMFAKSIEGVAESTVIPEFDPGMIIHSVEEKMGRLAADPIKSAHVPTRGLTKTEAFGALEESRAILFRLIDSAQGIDLSKIVYPHAVFGDLNLYEFLIFVARHEDRHRGQLTRQRELLLTQ